MLLQNFHSQGNTNKKMRRKKNFLMETPENVYPDNQGITW